MFQGIWLDIFDQYGIEILKINLKYIYGIKIQASVLENKKIIFELSKLNLKNKKLILNISGKNLVEIKSIIEIFEQLSFKEIILQCGYQDYPTSLKETNFNKVSIIEKKTDKERVIKSTDNFISENSKKSNSTYNIKLIVYIIAIIVLVIIELILILL